MWPFRRHHAQPSEDARAALQQAERALQDAEALDCAAQQVAERLERTHERNNFAAAVYRAIRGV